jgi:hypothetical protein
MDENFDGLVPVGSQQGFCHFDGSIAFVGPQGLLTPDWGIEHASARRGNDHMKDSRDEGSSPE